MMLKTVHTSGLALVAAGTELMSSLTSKN